MRDGAPFCTRLQCPKLTRCAQVFYYLGADTAVKQLFRDSEWCALRLEGRRAAVGGLYGTKEYTRLNAAAGGALDSERNGHYELGVDGFQSFRFAQHSSEIYVLRCAPLASGRRRGAFPPCAFRMWWPCSNAAFGQGNHRLATGAGMAPCSSQLDGTPMRTDKAITGLCRSGELPIKHKSRGKFHKIIGVCSGPKQLEKPDGCLSAITQDLQKCGPTSEARLAPGKPCISTPRHSIRTGLAPPKPA